VVLSMETGRPSGGSYLPARKHNGVKMMVNSTFFAGIFLMMIMVN